MAGHATDIEVAYWCDDCGGEFTVAWNIADAGDQYTFDTAAEHEDCPAAD